MSRAIGFELENIACQYLLSQNLILINRNYATKFGEIDLIMLDNDVLVFIEVRYRKNSVYGYPIETITRSKSLKILNSALAFINVNNQYKNSQFRFDVIGILGNIRQIRGDFKKNLFNSLTWHQNFTIEEYGYYNSDKSAF